MDYQYLTLFFSKKTGKICSYCASETPQNMSFFGDNEEDFSVIWDFLTVDYDAFLMKNIEFFKVDLVTKTLISDQMTNLLKQYR